MKITVIKKNGVSEPFLPEKIKKAVTKAADRQSVRLTDSQYDFVIDYVRRRLLYGATDSDRQSDEVKVGVYDLHPIVEDALDETDGDVAKSYRDYRNYKKENNAMMEKILSEVETLNVEGDKSNANADSRLITTKRFLEGCALSKASYQKFYLSEKERQANEDGYIYIHDLSQRKYTLNCSVFDMATVFKDGFKMGSIEYTEPKTLSSAFNLLGDVILSASSQQYGGFTVPEVDKLLAPYAHKSYLKYLNEYYDIAGKAPGVSVYYEDVNYSGSIKKEILSEGETLYLRIKRKEYDDEDSTTSTTSMSPRYKGVSLEVSKYPILEGTVGGTISDGTSADNHYCGTSIGVGASNGTSFDNHSSGGTSISVGISEGMSVNDLSRSKCGESNGYRNNFVVSCGSIIKLTTIKNISIKILKILPRQNKVIVEINTTERTDYKNGCSALNGRSPEIKEITLNATASYSEGRSVSQNSDSIFSSLSSFSVDVVRLFFESVSVDLTDKSDKYATDKVRKDFEQGFQGLECMLNSCANAKGDYSFVSFSFGLGEKKFERMASSVCLSVRQRGQGRDGHRKPVLFPKLIFLFDEYKHTGDGSLTDVFDEAVECSAHCMYPDFFNVRMVEDEHTRNYEYFDAVVSPMGCRSQVSPFYESGNYEQQNEYDRPVTVGRWNIGVVSLNLIMIYKKAQEENKNFYQVLDEYLEMIRQIHKKTWSQLSKLKASSYPLAFMEGGFWNGHLNADDSIEPCLKASTASFGITGLNELEELVHQKSLVEDGSFALEVAEYIYDRMKEFKKEDGISYSIYGTPAESLSGKQVIQFRKKYGIIKNVSDREYLSNSFHCHVSEDISPIEKQRLEERFWKFFSGGRIQYNRVTHPEKNKTAIKQLILEAMRRKFYYGINFPKSFCDNCGAEFTDTRDTCPKCGAGPDKLITIDRVCGYLGYSKVEGTTRMNSSKMSEIKDRKSM